MLIKYRESMNLRHGCIREVGLCFVFMFHEFRCAMNLPAYSVLTLLLYFILIFGTAASS